MQIQPTFIEDFLPKSLRNEGITCHFIKRNTAHNYRFPGDHVPGWAEETLDTFENLTCHKWGGGGCPFKAIYGFSRNIEWEKMY